MLLCMFQSGMASSVTHCSQSPHWITGCAPGGTSPSGTRSKKRSRCPRCTVCHGIRLAANSLYVLSIQARYRVGLTIRQRSVAPVRLSSASTMPCLKNFRHPASSAIRYTVMHPCSLSGPRSSPQTGCQWSLIGSWSFLLTAVMEMSKRSHGVSSSSRIRCSSPLYFASVHANISPRLPSSSSFAYLRSSRSPISLSCRCM